MDVVVKPKQQFDLSPLDKDHGQSKIITIFGAKGEGKSSLAFGICKQLGNTAAAFSYDNKTVAVWQDMYNADGSMKVYDAIRYFDPSKSAIRETSSMTLDYIESILNSMRSNPPDWIIHDGLEILAMIAEMKMRYDNNIGPVQAFANLNLWKDRRMIIRHIHKMSVDIAKKGVIYTTYAEKDETITDGAIVTKKDVPKWTDAILYETDIVLYAFAIVEKTAIKHFVRVYSSKDRKFMTTGVVVDVSNCQYKKLFTANQEVVEDWKSIGGK